MDNDETLNVRYYQGPGGTVGRRSGTGEVELPDGATELSAEQYEQLADKAREAQNEWAAKQAAEAEEAAKQRAAARKKAAAELVKAGISKESARFILGIER